MSNRINELVVERALGWEATLETDDAWYHSRASDEETYDFVVWNGSQGTYPDSPDMCVDHDGFNPSEDLDDAMLVLRKLELTLLTCCDRSICTKGQHTSIAETPTEAIGATALKVCNTEP